MTREEAEGLEEVVRQWRNMRDERDRWKAKCIAARQLLETDPKDDKPLTEWERFLNLNGKRMPDMNEEKSA